MSAALDVLVVGAGLAGLTAALDLVRAGATVRVLEGSDRAGGLIRTERSAGCIVEAGPDAMLVQKSAGLELCRELGLGDELIPTQPPRTAHVLRLGRLHALPRDTVLGLPLTDTALDGLTMLSEAGRERLARDLVVPQPPRDRGDESIGGFFRRRFGPEAVTALAQPLLGGIHAGDVDRLSLPALFPDLAVMDAAGGSVLAQLRKRRTPATDDGVFRGLRGGMQSLVEALLTNLPSGVLVHRQRVVAIESGSPHRVVTADGTSAAARAVLLCVPAWQASALLAAADPILSEACRAIPYSSSATVTLAYRRDAIGHPLDGMGFIVPRGEPATRLLAASWVTSKWPGRAPAGVALIRVFAGGTFDEDLLEIDDGALAALAHRDLAALLEIRAEPTRVAVFRWPRSSPQYVVGHSTRVAAIDARCAAIPGLFLTGSAFRGVGIPDTIADARRTAAAVASFLG